MAPAKNNAHYDVIVIGGGASGMMAAGRAAELGARVLLLEKNAALGEKLKITGGGRCNITNAESVVHTFLGRYGTARNWLHSSFAQFGVPETFSFFTSRGLPLKTEDRLRVFPQSDKALDVFRVLEKYLAHRHVEIETQCIVSGFEMKDKTITGVKTKTSIYTARSYVLATGGKSHPETGSTGDGFRWLRTLGHDVSEPTPTVVPLSTSDAWTHALAGITLPGAKITFFVGEQKKFTKKGDILCTHFGLSGPTILNSAVHVADLLHEGMVTAAIDLFPTLDLGALDTHITTVFDVNKNKTFGNTLKHVVADGIGNSLLPLVDWIDPTKKVHSITKEERKRLTHLLKSLPVRVRGLMGYDKAVVADGGLSLREVDGKTMASRRHPNLYVTGDILDIRRPSGGFSLQLCWTTGYVAGTHAAKSKK